MRLEAIDASWPSGSEPCGQAAEKVGATEEGYEMGNNMHVEMGENGKSDLTMFLAILVTGLILIMVGAPEAAATVISTLAAGYAARTPRQL